MGSIGHRHRVGSMNADGMRIASRRVEEEDCGGIADVEESGIPTSVSEGGGVPLKDIRKERYCRKVVDGVEPLEAFYQGFYDEEGKERIKRSTALSLRARYSKYPEVVARIEWLSKGDVGKSSITKERKRNMLDTLLEKTYARAMSDEASAKDVGACLDVLARHDMVNGDIVKPKLEVVFPQLESLLGGGAMKAVEKRLGIGVSPGRIEEKGSGVIEI